MPYGNFVLFGLITGKRNQIRWEHTGTPTSEDLSRRQQNEQKVSVLTVNLCLLLLISFVLVPLSARAWSVPVQDSCPFVSICGFLTCPSFAKRSSNGSRRDDDAQIRVHSLSLELVWHRS